MNVLEWRVPHPLVYKGVGFLSLHSIFLLTDSDARLPWGVDFVDPGEKSASFTKIVKSAAPARRTCPLSGFAPRERGAGHDRIALSAGKLR